MHECIIRSIIFFLLVAPHHNCKSNYTTHDESCNGLDNTLSYFDDTDIRKNELANNIKVRTNSFKEDEEDRATNNSSDFTNSDNNFVSEDDGIFCNNYDADDEVDPYLYTENNNKKFIIADDEDEDEEFFSFRKSSDQTVYTLQRALEIIQDRPKLTDRLFIQDDSDDCFRESEYDVIDTDDNLDVVEVINDVNTHNPNTSHIEIKVRSHTLDEDGRLIEVTTTPVRDKNKLKTGKVKSLPSIRFPIRNKKFKHYRSTSEVSLISSTKSNKLNGHYDDLILQQNQRKISKQKSESDGQQGTSDADYLTTIHRYYSNDSQVDTNIDTQAEDIAPTKFLPMLSRRRRRRSITKLDFSPQNKISSLPLNGSVKGRFQVSTVREVNTPDNENNTINSIFSGKNLHVPVIENGHLANCSTEIKETDILLNDDLLENHSEQTYLQMPQLGESFLLKSYEVI